MRSFAALHEEMLAEEAHVFLAVMEMMRREHRREYRRAGFELNLHQAIDDSLRDELMPINTAVDDQPRRNDPRIPSARCEALRMQRDFECAGDFEEIDIVVTVAVLLHGFEKGRLALVDDIAVPASLNERNARTVRAGSGYCV